MTDPDWERAEEDGWPELLEDDALRRGLEDSATGRVKYLGDFSQYLLDNEERVETNIDRGEEEILKALTEDFSDLEEE